VQQDPSTAIYTRWGLISLRLYKENNKLRDWKNVFTYSPWAPHTYEFVVLTSLTHPRKILLDVLQIGKAKDLSGPLGIFQWVAAYYNDELHLRSFNSNLNSNSIFQLITIIALARDMQFYQRTVEQFWQVGRAPDDGRTCPKPVVTEKQAKIISCIWHGNICLQSKSL
jgi:hypothetical protein